MYNSGKTDVGVAFLDGFPVLSLNTARVAHAAPLAVKALFEWSDQKNTKTLNRIFDKTEPEKSFLAKRSVFAQTVASMMIAVLSNFAFCFVPIAVIGFVLMEKSKDVKHQLLISGCSAKAYWLSMLVWDTSIALFPVLMLYVFLWMFGFEAFIRYAQASCTLLVLFVFAAVSSAYVLTHFVNGTGMANSCLLFGNGVGALLLVFMFLVADFAVKIWPAAAAAHLILADHASEDMNEPVVNNDIVDDLINVRCTRVSESLALANISSGDVEFVAKFCDVAWWFYAFLPALRLTGLLLPGFNLLDGLARIVARHALLYLGIPSLLRSLGSISQQYTSSYFTKFLSQCGEPISIVPTSKSANQSVVCESYKSKALSSLQSMKREGRNCTLGVDGVLRHFIPNIDKGLRGLLRDLTTRDTSILSGLLPEQVVHDAAARISSHLGEQLSSEYLADKMYEYILEQLYGNFGNFTAQDGDQLKLLGECVSQVPEGGVRLALASVLYAIGDSRVVSKVRDTFDRVASSAHLQEFFENTLPAIGSRKRDMLGGECLLGPQMGPWSLQDFVPRTFSDQFGALNTTAFGPIKITVPCDLGLKGDHMVHALGQVLEQVILLPTVGDSLLRLMIAAFVYVILSLLIEDFQQTPWFSKWLSNKEPCPAHMLALEDDDVKAEKLRVDNVDPTRQIMYVSKLRKVFGGGMFGGRAIHAVRGVTWAADKGMVFGLLGVNGAGKTTSFKMMSGILTPSAGEVRILGIDVQQEKARARRFIGYCPQFDALIEKMTVTEHMYLYGRVKGLTGRDLSVAIDKKMKDMQLDMYVNRRSGSLSGGNKRKLSVAMAIIGEPPVVFLDEPSTGMDPFARRFMWSVIHDVAEKRKQSVVVLTTHSMEEAEALCSCIAIQVDGQLRCLGSAQQIKSRYGGGYEISVKFAPAPEEALLQAALAWHIVDLTAMVSRSSALEHLHDDPRKSSACTDARGPLPDGVDEVSARVLVEWSLIYDKLLAFECFLTAADGGGQEQGSVSLVEAHGPTARWLLANMGEIDLAAFMTAMQNVKATHGISDYACNQASLEQIFNSFAAQQEANVGR
eukprot:TRINITY_DN5383_c0_g1_i1.p1 TRINITY_DN5383_c0_g1~~TRINITY_DN5383_c0_g1_i1.p1  ORF type:complete len:1224 (-),score=136.10 TRINITY_DN5383_c0_g1_i1:43-3276(-)